MGLGDADKVPHEGKKLQILIIKNYILHYKNKVNLGIFGSTTAGTSTPLLRKHDIYSRCLLLVVFLLVCQLGRVV